MNKIYTYAKCGTCRRALKWLDEKGIAYNELPIRDQPPSKAELKTMLGIYGGEIRRLFNTSGQDYRALNLKERLPDMSETEAIELLSQTGNLVKRPFLLTQDSGVVGFREEEWQQLLLG